MVVKPALRRPASPNGHCHGCAKGQETLMFTLELDMLLRFVPPMLENSAGGVVTRTIELPFVPFVRNARTEAVLGEITALMARKYS
jgi:hypothetical protein